MGQDQHEDPLAHHPHLPPQSAIAEADMAEESVEGEDMTAMHTRLVQLQNQYNQQHKVRKSGDMRSFCVSVNHRLNWSAVVWLKAAMLPCSIRMGSVGSLAIRRATVLALSYPPLTGLVCLSPVASVLYTILLLLCSALLWNYLGARKTFFCCCWCRQGKTSQTCQGIMLLLIPGKG